LIGGTYYTYGNSGGKGSLKSDQGYISYATFGGGGGGGAGSSGLIGDADYKPNTYNITKGGGDGGDGVIIPITGQPIYWAGGGGGGCFAGIAGKGGFGGGGGGSSNNTLVPELWIDMTDTSKIIKSSNNITFIYNKGTLSSTIHGMGLYGSSPTHDIFLNNNACINTDYSTNRGLISGTYNISTSTFSQLGFPIGTTITAFVVGLFKLANTTAYGPLFNHGNRDTDLSLEQHGISGKNNWFTWQTNNIHRAIPGSGTVPTNNEQFYLDAEVPFLAICRYSQTTVTTANDTRNMSYTIYKIADGSIMYGNNRSYTQTLAAFDNTTNRLFYIGQSNNSERFAGYIGEIMYYKSTLSFTDESTVRDYLINKWKYVMNPMPLYSSISLGSEGLTLPSVVLREYPPSAMTANTTTLAAGTDAAGNAYGAGTYIFNYPFGISDIAVYTLFNKLIGGNHTGSIGALYNGYYIGDFCNDTRTSFGTYFGSCTGTLNDRVWTFLSSTAPGISIDLTQDTSSNKYYGSTFTYTLPSPIYLQNLQLYNRSSYSTFFTQAPKSFRIYGMNIGDNGWTQIANYTNLNAWNTYTSTYSSSISSSNIIWDGATGAENLTFKINANTSYSIYGFVVNTLLGTTNENFTLAEIKLFGTDYYVPPSGLSGTITSGGKAADNTGGGGGSGSFTGIPGGGGGSGVVIIKYTLDNTNNIVNALTTTNDYYYYFTHNNANSTYTPYHIYLNQSLYCDMLLIGGGGGGGGDIGGGGGAGGVVYKKGITLNPGTYIIQVGAGGSSRPATTGTVYNSVNGNNGITTKLIYDNSMIYEAKGGGGGGNYNQSVATVGNSGGSGGGGAPNNASGSFSAGGATNQGTTYLVSPGGYTGTSGYRTSTLMTGGGGGGCGSTGLDVLGGVGIENDITGINMWYAAGGGGTPYSNLTGDINIFSGASGIGGNAHIYSNTVRVAHAGLNNTGSGGGGGGYPGGGLTPNNNDGGAGGSGVAIIRFNSSNLSDVSIINQHPKIIHNYSIGTSININGQQSYYYQFTSNNGNYIMFPQDTLCDIFMIGGGGGGGRAYGGGGGAGSYCYTTQLFLKNTVYELGVGTGGTGQNADSVAGKAGGDTFIKILDDDNYVKIVKGGGYGGGYSALNGGTGGCGGGGYGWNNNSGSNIITPGGNIINNSLTNNGIGFCGGKGINYHTGNALAGGGGGGCASPGTDYSGINAGNGGDGVLIDIKGFKEVYGGGGGGGAWGEKTGAPGYGGGNYINNLYINVGGAGGKTFSTIFLQGCASDALINTGSGGGGGGNYPSNGGNGSNGTIIIRYNNGISYNTDMPNIVHNNVIDIPKNIINNTSNDYYYQFNSTIGNNNITFNKETNCDILVVGGGGSGSLKTGKGGDAGTVICTNYTFPVGTYKIGVGSGGKGQICYNDVSANNNPGTDSYIVDSTNNILFLAKGGNTTGNNIIVNNSNISPPSLICWYKFNDPSNLTKDYSKYNNNLLTIGTGGTFMGNSAYFNSSTSAVNYFRSEDLNIDVPITISYWVKVPTSGVGAYHTFVSYSDKVSENPCIQFDYFGTSTKILKVYTALNSHWIISPESISAIPANTWTHITYTLSQLYSVVTTNLYINGVLNRTATGSVNCKLKAGCTKNIVIGYSGDNRGANCHIRDFRFYNTELVQEEITQIYNNINSPLYSLNINTGLIGWYKFDNSANVTFDSSVYNNNLVNNNVTSFNNYASFNGSSNMQLTLNNSPFINGFAISIWYYVTSTNTNQEIFSLNYNLIPPNTQYVYTPKLILSINGSSLILKYWNVFNTTFIDQTITNYNTINTWNHVVITIDTSNNLTIYYNNIPVYTRTAAITSENGIYLEKNIYMLLGGETFTSNTYFTGYMDDIRLYNRTLNSVEISDIYNFYSQRKTFTELVIKDNNVYNSFGTNTGLIGNYKCLSYTDDSGLGNHLNYGIYRFPPAPLINNITTISKDTYGPNNGLYNIYNANYGNGTYVTSASSEFTSTEFLYAYRAFNYEFSTSSGTSTWTTSTASYNVSSGAYIGSIATTISGTAYLGEWLQIQLPIPIVLTNYRIFTWNADYARGPKIFYIGGSNDGTNWTLVNSQTNITGYNATGKSFVLPSTNQTAYSYYRLVVNSTSNNWCSIQEWELYGYPQIFSTSAYLKDTDGLIIPYNNDPFSNGLTASYWYKSNSNLLNQESYDIITNRYPPQGLRSTTVTVAGCSYGNGQYVVSSSSNLSTSETEYMAFDYSLTASYWSVTGKYTGGTGVYSGAVTTTLSGISYSGEWLQIQLPYPIFLTNYVINAMGNDNRGPNVFYIAGSNDGGTWSLLDTRLDVTYPNDRRSFVIEPLIIPYRYYRLVVNKNGTHSTGLMSIYEWELYGKESIYKYPSGALTAATTTITTQAYGNGTYIASSSGNYSAFEADFKAFNFITADTGDNWTTTTTYYDGAGNYTRSPATTTTVSGTTHSGEWLQLQLPIPIVLTNYVLYTRNNDLARGPKNFIIAGSNDSSTWFMIDTENNVNMWSALGKSFTVNININSSYSYYRIIILTNNGSGVLSITEWELYGYPSVNRYPPAPLKTYSNLLNNYTYGNGLYISNASSEYSTTDLSWKAFNYEQAVLYSYNNGLVSGNSTDSAATTYVNLLNLGITVGSTLTNWSFFTNITGRSITPLILEDTGSSNYTIRGIGTSRSVTATGINTYSFGLVAGTNVFINSNYRFGWKDGTTTSSNTGVISFTSNNAVAQTTYALTSNSGTNITLNTAYAFGNQALGNRTYYFKLDFTMPTYWTSSTQSYNASGAYTGSFTTIVSGISYSGEWLQIQLPTSIILNNYKINTLNSDYTRGPKIFYIGGSNDGITWTLIDSQTNITGYNANIKTFVLSTNQNAYLYYRMIINSINSTAVNYCSIDEWELYGYEPTTKKYYNSFDMTTLSNQIAKYHTPNTWNNITISLDMLNNFNFYYNGLNIYNVNKTNNIDITNTNLLTFNNNFVDVTSSLIAQYKFFDLTDSIGTNHLNNFGTTINNGIVSFTNTGQYLTIPTTLNPYTIWNGNGITFSIWFRCLTTSGSWARIFDFADGSGSTATNWFMISRNATNNTITFEIAINSVRTTYTTTTNYVDNKWHHVIWSISSTGVWMIYLDNISINPSITRTIPNITWTKQYIGKSGFTADGSYLGDFHDFRIYNTVLSQTNIANIYYSSVYSMDTAESNLISYYKFDDITDSIGTNHLTNYGTTINNGIVTFTSANQYLSIPTSLNPYTIWLNNGITFSVWFKASTSTGAFGKIFDFGDGTTSAANWIMISKNNTNNTIYFEIGVSSVKTTFTTTNNYIDNIWHHIIWSISATGVWSVYIDNVNLNASITRTIPNITWTKQSIGRSSFSSDGWYIGSIDEFRIYNTVLTPEQINIIYNYTKQYLYFNNFNNNLVAYYKFDNNTDSIGTNHFVNNSCTFNYGYLTITNNNYISYPTTLNLYNIWNNNGLTLSLWFRGNPTTSTNNGRIIDFSDGLDGSNPTNSIFVCKLSTGNTVRFCVMTNGSQISYDTTNNYIDNNWHHIVWTINVIGGWVIYIDNIKFVPTVISILPNATWTRQYMGYKAYPSEGAIAGDYDDFRIYNTVLTSDNVNNLYNNYINLQNTISNEQYLSIMLGRLLNGNMKDIKIYNRALTNNEITELVNINKNIKTLTNEKQYPPQKWDYISGNTFTVTNATYGLGNYTVASNSYFGPGSESHFCFDYNYTLDSSSCYISPTGVYDATGVYINSNGGNLDGSYFGQCITIKLPYPIKLTKQAIIFLIILVHIFMKNNYPHHLYFINIMVLL